MSKAGGGIFCFVLFLEFKGFFVKTLAKTQIKGTENSFKTYFKDDRFCKNCLKKETPKKKKLTKQHKLQPTIINNSKHWGIKRISLPDLSHYNIQIFCYQNKITKHIKNQFFKDISAKMHTIRNNLSKFTSIAK